MKQPPCWKTALFRAITAVDDAVATLHRDQLSAVSVAKVYKKDRFICPVPEHPTFLYTSIAQTTHTNSKHLHEASNDEIYLFNCSQAAKSGEPLGHSALFWPPVLSWLLCSSAVSWWEIFQFWLCPASGIWCCSPDMTVPGCSFLRKRDDFLRLWWFSVAGAVQSQIGGLD